MDLTEGAFHLYAMRAYHNPHCTSVEEFHDDLNRVKYVKRLFRRYVITKELNPLQIRLILNHLTVFYNVFRIEDATRILFFKIEPELWPILKTFLQFLHFMPLVVKGGLDGDSIPIDIYIHSQLKAI